MQEIEKSSNLLHYVRRISEQIRSKYKLIHIAIIKSSLYKFIPFLQTLLSLSRVTLIIILLLWNNFFGSEALF